MVCGLFFFWGGVGGFGGILCLFWFVGFDWLVGWFFVEESACLVT